LTHQADTIDRVVSELDAILDWSRAAPSRPGYFPGLYRQVTAKVQEGIEQRFFDDGDRMERLDVVFANRYLSAIDSCRHGAPVTKA
jgi:hypothetical protein